MLTFEQIKENSKTGEYYAITATGRRYEATYTTDYGGVMFFCVPGDEAIIGYEPKGGENGNA